MPYNSLRSVKGTAGSEVREQVRVGLHCQCRSDTGDINSYAIFSKTTFCRTEGSQAFGVVMLQHATIGRFSEHSF